MAREGIHPDYHTVNVVMTDGTKYQTRSTYGKEGDTLTLDVDPKTHPAWVGGVHLKKTGRLESFNSRFGSMAFKADASKDAAKYVPPKKKAAPKKAVAPKPEKKEKPAAKETAPKAEAKEEAPKAE
jgi:large subunit ribosomal protein L31